MEGMGGEAFSRPPEGCEPQISHQGYKDQDEEEQY
jgi:hypothetical protein